MSARDPMVRDPSLRDAPHHEDRFVRPHPEEPPKAASRRIEVVHCGMLTIMTTNLRGSGVNSVRRTAAGFCLGLILLFASGAWAADNVIVGSVGSTSANQWPLYIAL